MHSLQGGGCLESCPSAISDYDSDSDTSDEEYYYDSDSDVEIYELEPEEEDDPGYFEDVVDVSKEKFKAAIAGRSAVARPPRFDIKQIRPWEIMFVDEKEYDVTQRGGYTTSFILVDLKSDAWFKMDQTSKKQHGESFYTLMIKNSVHLKDYTRTVYSDGCGSMTYAKKSLDCS